MPTFATGAAIAAASTSTVYAPNARRPVRLQPTPTFGHPGETATPTDAIGTVGEGPPLPRWDLQRWRPASVLGTAAEPSRETPSYSGGDPGWNAQPGTGLNEAIYARHAQRIPRLTTSHMSGASSFGGQLSTQASADGTAGLSGHAPILSPAIIPKIRTRNNAGNRFNHGGVSNANVPSVFVPAGGLNAFGS